MASSARLTRPSRLDIDDIDSGSSKRRTRARKATYTGDDFEDDEEDEDYGVAHGETTPKRVKAAAQASLEPAASDHNSGKHAPACLRKKAHVKVPALQSSTTITPPPRKGKTATATHPTTGHKTHKVPNCEWAFTACSGSQS